jgi:hypothetical protein
VQSEQQFARLAAAGQAAKPGTGHGPGIGRGRDGREPGHRAARVDREERRATPSRMARAYAELLAARPFRLTTFPNDVRSGSGSCACRRNQQ